MSRRGVGRRTERRTVDEAGGSHRQIRQYWRERRARAAASRRRHRVAHGPVEPCEGRPLQRERVVGGRVHGAGGDGGMRGGHAKNAWGGRGGGDARRACEKCMRRCVYACMRWLAIRGGIFVEWGEIILSRQVGVPRRGSGMEVGREGGRLEEDALAGAGAAARGGRVMVAA